MGEYWIVTRESLYENSYPRTFVRAGDRRSLLSSTGDLAAGIVAPSPAISGHDTLIIDPDTPISAADRCIR